MTYEYETLDIVKDGRLAVAQGGGDAFALGAQDAAPLARAVDQGGAGDEVAGHRRLQGAKGRGAGDRRPRPSIVPDPRWGVNRPRRD